MVLGLVASISVKTWSELANRGRLYPEISVEEQATSRKPSDTIEKIKRRLISKTTAGKNRVRNVGDTISCRGKSKRKKGGGRNLNEREGGREDKEMYSVQSSGKGGEKTRFCEELQNRG